MFVKLVICMLLFAVISGNCKCVEELNKYSLMLKRNFMKYMDSYNKSLFLCDKFHAKENSSDILKEHLVSLYLQLLQYEEVKYENKYYYRPIEKNLDFIQKKSRLYKLLRKLPKGGNLHLREFQELDRFKLINMLRESNDYEYLYICDQIENQNCKKMKYYLNYFKNKKIVPTGWTKLNESRLTTQEIVDKTTLIGLLKALKVSLHPSDSELRWNLTQDSGLFSGYQSVSEYNATRFRYMKAVLDAALDENLQLLEFRRFNFGTVWYYSKNGTKEYLPAAVEMEELERLKKEFIEKNSKFIDFSFIIMSRRSLENFDIDSQLDTAINYNRKHPHLVRGFDLDEEEDRGHALLNYGDSIIKARNYSIKESNDTFKLYLHNPETSWSESESFSEVNNEIDTFENIYDALVIETHRIRHGLGYIKHPQLYKVLIEKDIAIELCLTSNHVLGYIPDLRTHPGINYYRSGVPVILTSNDPGSFGYNELTLEFYLALLSWDLNLYDLKQLALNSIKYSSLSDKEKPSAYSKWSEEWDKYIDATYDFVCNLKFNTTISVTDIIPSYSYFTKTANITVYGNGFENLFCKPITCIFGTFKTHGYLIDLNEIICESPKTNKTYLKLPFKIITSDNVSGVNEILTDFNFTLLGSPKLFSRKNGENARKNFIALNMYLFILAFNFLNLF